MATEKKAKKEKEIVIEFEGQMKDIRQQLNEQLKCLDARLDTQLAMLAELQDFFRRRSEIEIEYSKNLDRLVKQIMMRHKTEKQRLNASETHKREYWPGYSTYTCWQTLLATSKKQSKDHAILSDLYANQMCNRFTDLMDDTQRIYRKCRDIGVDSHEEIIKVLNELQSAMKSYHIYHGESKQAESKLQHVKSQRMKIEQHAGKGSISGRKFKAFEKQTEKRQNKYQENKLKALKARNEYILCIDAANASLHKYFVDDLPDLIDCIDYGYHSTLARAMLMYVSAEENLKKSRQACIDLMNKCISDLDQRTDKQRFLEIQTHTFSLPKKFEFQAHKGDEVCQVSAQKSVQEDLLERSKRLAERLNTIKLDNDETWKTLETAEKSLMEMISVKDYDVGNLFNEDRHPPKSPHEHAKKRSDRMETEAFYIDKFRKYTIAQNLICRLHAKNTSIEKALGEGTWAVVPGSRPPSVPPKPKKRRIGRAPRVGQPKLFGGSIEEYVEATNQEIPLVVRSCIRIINLYGLHHQGVFRVSGSQHEINEFKNCFEKGEDPMIDVNDGRDINSVAGVLKLYFRELREPLFPIQIFDELIAASNLEGTKECVERIRELLSTLPRPIIIVMRYLFAFLNHLSENSDENMMDPYNLAICFGPTLLPIPGDRDQVQYQSNVNNVIKTIINHHEEVFPNDGGPKYEKFLTEEAEPDDNVDGMSEGDDDRDNASEEEPEVIEAVAQYDFSGRTERELTFKKGDVLVVFNQVSTDWWEGAFQGREGLIPDKYIQLRQREEERSGSGSGEDDKRRSTESLPAKPFAMTSLLEENLDKAASHPNISMAGSSSQSSSNSDLSKSDIQVAGSTPSLTSRETVESSDSPKDPIDEKPEELPFHSTDDLAQEIDTALAEVMSGLESLEMQQKADKIKMKMPSANPKHTPDLVLDLPVSDKPPSPKETCQPDSPTLSTAEMFAKSDQCTIKKAGSMPRSVSSAAAFSKMESERAIKRSNSASATMNNRNRQREFVQGSIKPSQGTIPEKLSPGAPPSDPDKNNALKPTLPENEQSIRARSLTPDRPPPVPERPALPVPDRHYMHDRSVTPDRPLPVDKVNDKPERPDKPKPPLRVKPPVMKKPARSPEIVKKFGKGSDGNGGPPS